jgi:hypothetical protein
LAAELASLSSSEAKVDEDVFLGWIVAGAWLGLFLYLPISSVRTHGFRAFALDAVRHPLTSVGSALMWMGTCVFLLWILTADAVPVQWALLAIPGWGLMSAGHRYKR